MHLRFVVLFVLLLLGACAPKAEFSKKIGLDELEALDKVLTEPWPDIADNVTLTKAEQQALETKLSFSYQLDDFSARAIKKEFVFLNRKIRDSVDRWLRRSEPYLPYIRKVLAERGLPEELVCLPYIESGFSIKAYSPAGASGLWQFIPGTGRRYGLRSNNWVDERLHFIKATYAAADYLSMLYGMFHEWPLALAGYNAGEGKIQDGLAITGAKNFFELAKKNDQLSGRPRLRTETLEYVPRLIAMAKLVKNLKALGFDPLHDDRAVGLEAMEVRPGIDLRGLSEAIGVDWETFHLYNLSFRRGVTPPGETSTIHVPTQLVAKAQDHIAKQPALTKVFMAMQEESEAPARSYVVKKGDTWASVSSKTGVPVAKLKDLNKRTHLKPGGKLALPAKKVAPEKIEHAQAGKGSASGKSASATVEKAGGAQARYVVQKGDTPGGIAKKLNTTAAELLRINNIKSDKDLRLGQTLVGPAAAQENRKREEPAKKETAHKEEPVRKDDPAKKGEPVKLYATAKPEPPQKAEATKKSEPIKKEEPVKKIEPVKPVKKEEPVKKAEQGKKKILYLVKSGETVGAIAKRFNVSTSDLLKWNNLTPTTMIRPGDKLSIVSE